MEKECLLRDGNANEPWVCACACACMRASVREAMGGCCSEASCKGLSEFRSVKRKVVEMWLCLFLATPQNGGLFCVFLQNPH